MPQGQDIFLGLNQNGVIVFIILLFVCPCIFFVPWLVDSLRGYPQTPV